MGTIVEDAGRWRPNICRTPEAKALARVGSSSIMFVDVRMVDSYVDQEHTLDTRTALFTV
jgi:hypothetical protein